MTPLERIEGLLNAGIPLCDGWAHVRQHIFVVSRMLHHAELSGGQSEMPLWNGTTGCWILAREVSATFGGQDVESLIMLMCAMGVASRRKEGRRFVYRLAADFGVPVDAVASCRASHLSAVQMVDARIEEQRNGTPEGIRTMIVAGGAVDEAIHAYRIIAIGLASGRYELFKAHPTTTAEVRMAHPAQGVSR